MSRCRWPPRASCFSRPVVAVVAARSATLPPVLLPAKLPPAPQPRPPPSLPLSLIPRRPTVAQSVRLASQASFGATDALLTDIRSGGIASWISARMALSRSRYSAGGSAAIQQNTRPDAIYQAFAGSGTS